MGGRLAPVGVRMLVGDGKMGGQTVETIEAVHSQSDWIQIEQSKRGKRRTREQGRMGAQSGMSHSISTIDGLNCAHLG